MEDAQRVAVSYHGGIPKERLDHLEEPATIVTHALDPAQPVTIDEFEAAEAQNGSNYATTIETAVPDVMNVDDDSAVGSDITSYSTSVPSTLFELIEEEDGRSYHKYHAGKYLLPSDAIERERLDLLHYIWTMLTFGGNYYLAPVCPDAQAIMDMGAGTGIWAVNIGDSMPSAKVFGIDLSPVEPLYRPRNVQFYVDDLEAPWLDESVFDFIFARDSTLCFEKPSLVLQSAFKALKPGGYIEFQNIILPFRCDGETLRGTAFREWMDMISKGAENLSRNWHTASACRASMEQVGLVDIHEKEYTWPIGTWPKRDCDKLLGALVYSTLVELKGLYAISAKVLRKGMKMDIGEINDLIGRVEQELSRNINKIAIPVTVLYGRKPTC